MTLTIGNIGVPAIPVTAGAGMSSAAPLPQGGQPPAEVKAPAAVSSASAPASPQQPQSAQVQKAVDALKQLIDVKAPNSLAF
jgi:hypothetical protein